MKIYEELEISCSFTIRESSYINNFISYMNFRVLDTSFSDLSLKNPLIKVKLLGTNKEWEIDPYTQIQVNSSKKKLKYIWDYHYYNLYQQGRIKDLDEINTENKDDLNYLNGMIEDLSVNNELKEMNINIHPMVKELLDTFYELEQYEINNKEEQFSVINRKNNMFFYLSVPNETIYIEVYQVNNNIKTFVAYAFICVANLEFDQSIYVPLNFFGENIAGVEANSGLIHVRAALYPINFTIDDNIFANMKSLDFDDVSQEFVSISDLKEVINFMDQNIKVARKEFWKNGIKSIFSDLRETKRLILNLMDFQNIREIYHPKIDMNLLKIKGN